MSGCGSAHVAPKGKKVTGVVTYKGNPVPKGTVTFYDKAQGMGGTAVINPDGTFETVQPLADGNYAVTLVPPLVEKVTPAGTTAKVPEEMAEIPAKYRSPSTSGFTAKVTETTTSFDFDMK
ncbi:carboxypeptidase regulatory-like domain-containing protein [Planctomicrobium sp. SH661]|uniref:carboxypeptidase regulatory-like domain-containing protein n=1 Tax=Planctomicrobium sp. SH661 TaxID=3448124 RepID=UPI003F5B7FEB